MDNVQINYLERPASSDINVAQSVLNRTFGDFLKHFHAKRHTLRSSNTPRAVTYGLTPFAENSNAVVIQPGVLIQDSATIVPAPGTYDGTTRIGFLRSPLQVSFPTPASVRWCLLEAKVVQQITSSARDIFDATTGKFVVTLVPKVNENTITTQWVEGTSTAIPPPSGGDWVPMYAALVQATGLVTDLATQQYSLAPDAHAIRDPGESFSRRPRVPIVRTDSTPNTLSNSIYLYVEEAVTNADLPADQTAGGVSLCWGGSTDASTLYDVASSTYLSPTVSLTPSTWFYLYMAPWFGVGPVAATENRRGVLVLSSVAPSVAGYNTAAIALPDPFGASAAPAWTAPCVGVLRRDPTNTGWTPLGACHHKYRILEWGADLTYTVSGDTAVTIPESAKPANARFVSFLCAASSPSADVNYVVVGLARTAGADTWTSSYRSGGAIPGSMVSIELTVPRAEAEELRSIAFGGILPTIDEQAVTLVGFEI